MPITNTKVGLCNEALLLLGSKPIESFDEGTDKATTCAMLYERTVGALLAMRTWNFTRQKQQLAQLVETPVNGWTYAYQLPSNRLAAPWKVFDSLQIGARENRRFEIFGDKLYSDDTTVVIDFQAEPDVSKLPVLFSELLVHALASKFAPIVTEQSELAGFYHERAYGTPSEMGRGGLFAMAAQTDAKSKPSDVFQTDEIVAARFA